MNGCPTYVWFTVALYCWVSVYILDLSFVEDSVPVLSCLPSEALQSQHSLGIGLSSRHVSFPQQVKQRPSSDRIWRAGHRVQFHMPGPLQPRQDESHALQFTLSLVDSESWINERVWVSHVYTRATLTKNLKIQLYCFCNTQPVKLHRSQRDTELHSSHPWTCSLGNRTDRPKLLNLEEERQISNNTKQCHWSISQDNNQMTRVVHTVCTLFTALN